MWFEDDEELTPEMTNELPADDGDDAGGDVPRARGAHRKHPRFLDDGDGGAHG